MAERTGCPVLTDLWSYVLVKDFCIENHLTIDVQLGSEMSSSERR
jgi:hypothetical protein